MRAYSLLIISFIFCTSKVIAQEHFLLPDNPAKCHLIKEGKFIREGESAKK